jgi:hypothetical protein
MLEREALLLVDESGASNADHVESWKAASWFGRRVPEAAACGGCSSAGRGSESQTETVHLEEVEEGDREVQSSPKGPFDTMDAL